jgi:hypothetical protein
MSLVSSWNREATSSSDMLNSPQSLQQFKQVSTSLKEQGYDFEVSREGRILTVKLITESDVDNKIVYRQLGATIEVFGLSVIKDWEAKKACLKIELSSSQAAKDLKKVLRQAELCLPSTNGTSQASSSTTLTEREINSHPSFHL